MSITNRDLKCQMLRKTVVQVVEVFLARRPLHPHHVMKNQLLEKQFMSHIQVGLGS